MVKISQKLNKEPDIKSPSQDVTWLPGNDNKLEEAILEHLMEEKRDIEDIYKEFVSKNYDKTMIDVVVDNLKSKSYIRTEMALVDSFLVDHNGNPIRFEKVCLASTRLGKNYIKDKSLLPQVNMNFSNVENSNIALFSQNMYQNIKVSEQTEDIKNKIYELENAIKKKDSSKIKEVFGYIADKAVDVAIAILVGKIIK